MSRYRRRKRDSLFDYVTVFFQLGLAILFSTAFLFSLYNELEPRVRDGFSSIEELEKKCVESKKRYYRVGAICRDGSASRATGRGACSHHGGVRQWVHDYYYAETVKDCENWARKRSWIE
jgi:hypothetical protein